MKLWFDTETRNLITEANMREEYQDWLVNRVSEEGSQYVLSHHADFTFEQFISNCTGYDGTLVPVYNAEYFKEVESNAGIHQ